LVALCATPSLQHTERDTQMANETRVTDWVSTDGRQAWESSDIASYRIWQQFDGLRWFQRHEWKYKDGSSDAESWIKGASGWCAGSKVVSEEMAA
jgi:hypothetical protein